MNVTVKFGRIADVDTARRCNLCAGKGIAPAYWEGPLETCRICKGSGVYITGYAYIAGDLPVTLGSIVEVPRTEYSRGPGPNIATVVDLGATHHAYSRILRVVEQP